jgi:hypothetical protein
MTTKETVAFIATIVLTGIISSTVTMRYMKHLPCEDTCIEDNTFTDTNYQYQYIQGDIISTYRLGNRRP